MTSLPRARRRTHHRARYRSRYRSRRLLLGLVAACCLMLAAGSLSATASPGPHPPSGKPAWAGTPGGPPWAGQPGGPGGSHKPGKGRAQQVRFATFNVALNRSAEGELVSDLAGGQDTQARAVAEIVQRTRPDVLLLNEIDHDDAGVALRSFQREYLEVGQGGARPIQYRHAFLAPSNTGVPSGFDLDNDGRVGGPGDAFGFGDFEGQYGMAVLSRFPIQTDDVRTFQNFLWRDMPGARLPVDPTGAEPTPWFSPEELDVVRLSSKSHWDVPIRVGRRTVHLLASHPTPPAFDGPERRNQLRNADEIRFWADYIRGARYPVDDEGRRGGLPRGARFVVAGDLNADPVDGNSEPGAMAQLLDLRQVRDTEPRSDGGREAAERQGGANLQHRGDPALDTADFNDRPGPGNLRVDYVLPDRRLPHRGSGVFWPRAADPLFRLTGDFPFPSSDHRLVWVDLLAR